MFLHHGKLEPALSARDYVEPAVFEHERNAIFATHWHLVGAQEVLSRPGGQVALELLGTPVVVRNEAGALVAFRNVCPHRHSLIVKPGEGQSETLRCQYHGWQFRADGSLLQLPDGASFKGFKAREACLERYRVERLGPLVFVNLSSGAPSLQAAFGPIYDELSTYFQGTTLRVRQTSEHACNWKIPVENAVESYHVPMVHPGTFKDYLPEEHHHHELEQTYSRYRPTRAPSRREQLAFVAFAIMHERHLYRRYQHVHVLPNYLISYSGPYLELVEIVPLAADQCRREAYGFLPVEVRKNPLAYALDVVHERGLRRGVEQILAEDSSVWTSVQEGSRHSIKRGVLSAREERVYHFQRWVAAKLEATPTARASTPDGSHPLRAGKTEA